MPGGFGGLAKRYMAEDAIDAINKAETVVILVGIGVAIYFAYQFYDQLEDFINGLFGVKAGAGTYAGAAAQVAAHPITSVGTILGLGQGSSAPSTNVPTQTSSTGYQKIGASGQVWNCTGPQGAPNDVCYPVTLDGSGNPTITGAAVQAASAN
jgi:hypothetical protein